MGCRSYVVHPAPVTAGEDREVSWKRVRETLDLLALRAAVPGIAIALMGLVLCRLSRSKRRLELDPSFRSHVFYDERGWFESDF